MKNLLLIICMSFAFLANAQTDVYLNIAHLLGAQPFALNTITTSPESEDFTVNRLEYYLSEITLIHDGGQETPVVNTWILVNAANASNYFLGNFSVTTLEGVKFGIGVNAAVNHLDPSSYPAAHPLAPKSPSMHWGWSAGYRFLALEGKSGNNQSQTFEIHGLGDANYLYHTTQTAGYVINGELHINLDADYTQLLKGILVASGPISHGETGIASDALKNLASYVFSESNAPNGVNEIAVSSLNCYPNPAQGRVNIAPFDAAGLVQIQVLNAQGQMVQTLMWNNSSVLTVENLSSGLYVIQMRSDARVIAQQKVIITN